MIGYTDIVVVVVVVALVVVVVCCLLLLLLFTLRLLSTAWRRGNRRVLNATRP